MGQEAKKKLKKGETMRISTGGMLPPGADSMVMVEYTEEMGDGTGAVMIDGKMQDDATVKQCKVMVELAHMLAEKDADLRAAYQL